MTQRHLYVSAIFALAISSLTKNRSDLKTGDWLENGLALARFERTREFSRLFQLLRQEPALKTNRLLGLGAVTGEKIGSVRPELFKKELFVHH